MLEISVYSHNLDSHREVFSKLSDPLDSLYRDYANNDKIVVLFEYWLFSLGALYKCYGYKGLKEFLLSRNNDPIAYSYYNEFDIKQDLPSRDKHKRFSFILWVNKYFPIQYRLAGAPKESLLKSLLVRYTRLIVSRIASKSNKDKLDKSCELINTYLLDLGINVDKGVIRSNIPKIFTSEQIKCNNLKEVDLNCAPIELLQFKNYEGLLLLNRKINIIGHQHGGGYDVSNFDPLTLFEKKLADSFIGWGFSEKNSHQTKYRINPSLNYKNKHDRVIWIEASKDSQFTSFCYPLLFDVKKDKKLTKLIYQELIDQGIEYFSKRYPGKLESDRYMGMRGSIIASEEKIEEFLVKNDLVIFDNSMHSLMFYCLENEILFLIVEKKDAMNHYTPHMLSWYKLLRKHRLFFHEDEMSLFGSRIKELKSPRMLPKEVINYYKNLFSS
tara:strand:+ start:508 stop:1830 length:1323 start_codon:yes stop_codon:yes gene_type:complete